MKGSLFLGGVAKGEAIPLLFSFVRGEELYLLYRDSTFYLNLLDFLPTYPGRTEKEGKRGPPAKQ